jgi:heme/copper-type cytochrome/quinol oxidase subunit 4
LTDYRAISYSIYKKNSWNFIILIISKCNRVTAMHGVEPSSCSFYLQTEDVMARTMTSGRHMESYRQDRTDWNAAVWSGLIAGAVFMMAEMLMVMVFMGQSPWAPPRMIAAMVMGQDVLPPPASFDMGVMMTAMMIHFPLSIVYGLIAGWIVHRMGSTNALLIGGVFGLAIYFINFHLIAPVVFPWFTQAQNWVSAVSHLLYGLVLGGAYAALRKHKPVGHQ